MAKEKQGMEAAALKREIRNPKSHRPTEENAARTQKVIEAYQGKNDLLRTWDLQPDSAQIAHHADLLTLRKRVRTLKNLLLHRANANIRL